VELRGRRLHVHCTGRGQPTVVVENGFDEFSFDWALVQGQVERFTRICTYDRAGYAWSDPGPRPRTFDQINLELRDALRRLKEKGPFVLVGHSFGGPVVRQFATAHPTEVVGLVFVDAVQEDSRTVIGGKAVRLRDSATGRIIPVPRDKLNVEDALRPATRPVMPAAAIQPPLDRLPPDVQRLHLWAEEQTARDATADSEREWSTEYFAQWAKKDQDGALGNLPLIVLTRADGDYRNDLDIPAAKLEDERRALQRKLVRLSGAGQQVIVSAGHDMHLEAPDTVARAIRSLVEETRRTRKLPEN
jgi:pimeloyl-ACP methyl ester carboxylesterase